MADSPYELTLRFSTYLELQRFVEDYNAGKHLLEFPPSSTSGTANSPDKPAEPPAEKATLEDCRAAAQQYYEVHGKDATVALLAQYGVGKPSELADDQLGSFLSAAQIAGA